MSQLIYCPECDDCQFQIWHDGHVQCVNCAWSFKIDRQKMKLGGLLEVKE